MGRIINKFLSSELDELNFFATLEKKTNPYSLKNKLEKTAMSKVRIS